jgi:DHA1 family bicyclomycin/chloramphenicol resistance-like MFS transporter
MRISPQSTAFTLLISLLVALPSFGIDMSLPALTETGAALGAAPAAVGLTMSTFMIGFAGAPLVYGPVSDRHGRKPVVIFAAALFVLASVGCGFARSLPSLLVWRFVQGAGAGASMAMAMAIVRDLFDGQAARSKISYIAVAAMVVPMVAPSLGAVLLRFGGWRLIHAVLAGIGSVLAIATLFGFAESARVDPANRLIPSLVVRNYLRVLTHSTCLGYIFCNAASFGMLFAYVSGSALFFTNVVGLRPEQYGLIFAATSFGIMAGAFINGHFGAWSAEPSRPLMFGLVLAVVAATLLLAITLAGWTPLPAIIALLISCTFAFGLVAPNAMHEAMQPLPEIAGAVSAASGFVQMTFGAASSGLVAILYDGRSAVSMASVMVFCSLVAIASYGVVARPARMRNAVIEQGLLDPPAGTGREVA